MLRSIALLVIVFSSSVLGEGESVKWCVQCASPELKDNWQVTGLSKHPDSLPFNSTCVSQQWVSSDLYSAEYVDTTCSTSCMEMFLPLNGVYQVVRGCQSSFLDQSQESLIVASGVNNCSYSKAAEKFNVVRFCDLSSGDVNHPCNSKLNDQLLKDDTIKSEAACTLVESVECFECEQLGDRGDCPREPTGRVTGPVCAKTTGRLNGEDYVKRGTTFIPPYLGNVCINSRSNHSYPTPLEGNSLALRQKRAIDIDIDLTQCFCHDALCNPASMSRVGLLSLVVVLAQSIVSFF